MSRGPALAALAALGLAACVHDHYACEVDTDCNLGDGGRCEANHRCTAYDAACPVSQRSYTAHSDELSGTCFVGTATPLDYCAAGQPPAPAEGCAAAVCAAVPACCVTGWSDACVLEAERRCPEVVCDTRIAITATRGTKTELWELRYDGAQWSATPHVDRVNMIAYLTPAAGTTEPRFASFPALNQLVVEGPAGAQTVDLDPARDYHDLQSLDFDRDLRDTIVLDVQDTTSRLLGIEVVKLAPELATRDLDLNMSARMAWGAITDAQGQLDGFPDAAVDQGADYKILVNGPANNRRERELDDAVMATFGANTPGSAGPLKSFAWADVDGDHTLDLVAFASTLRVHLGALAATPFVDVDCDPPSAAPTCAPEAVSYSGAVLPTDAGTRLIVAPFVDGATRHELFAVDVHADQTIAVEALPVPQSATCPGCSIQGVIVRDLDGDHQLDVVALDADLTLEVALSSVDPTLHTFSEVKPIVTTGGPFNSVRLSISGAPR